MGGEESPVENKEATLNRLNKEISQILGSISTSSARVEAAIGIGALADATVASTDVTVPILTSGQIASLSSASVPYLTTKGFTSQAQLMQSVALRAEKEIDESDTYEGFSEYYLSIMNLKAAETDLKSLDGLTLDEFDEGSATSYLDSLVDSVKKAAGWAYVKAQVCVDRLMARASELRSLFGKWGSEIKDKVVEAFREIIRIFCEIVETVLSAMFNFVGIVNRVAASKGFGFKSLKIAFEPPSVGSISVMGMKVPFPTFSLPKIEIEWGLGGGQQVGLGSIATSHPSQ